MRTWCNFTFFGFFALHSCSFSTGCAIIFHISPRHKLRPQLSEKHLGQSTLLTVLEIWPIKKYFKNSNFPQTVRALPELCGPLHATHGLYLTGYKNWDLGSNVGARLPGVEISNFWPCSYLLYFGLHFCALWQRVSWRTIRKMLGRSTLKQPPKLGVWNFWGCGTFCVCCLW